MNGEMCSREPDVLTAAASGCWPDDLRAHMAQCRACREVEAIGVPLLAMAAAEEVEPLPDADDLWWRARLDARRDARRRSMLPIDTVERAEPFIAALAVIVVLALRGEHVVDALARLATGGSTSASLHAAMPGLVVSVMVGGIAVMALMLLVALGAAFARD